LVEAHNLGGKKWNITYAWRSRRKRRHQRGVEKRGKLLLHGVRKGVLIMGQKKKHKGKRGGEEPSTIASLPRGKRVPRPFRENGGEKTPWFHNHAQEKANDLQQFVGGVLLREKGKNFFFLLKTPVSPGLKEERRVRREGFSSPRGAPREEKR